MFFKKNKLQKRQPKDINYQNQPIFSYRSSRKSKDRAFDRGTVSDDKIINNQRFSKVVILICLFVLFEVVVRLILLDSIVDIKVANHNSACNLKNYQDKINNIYDQSILNRTKLTINKDKIVGQIGNDLPELENVKILTGLLQHRALVEYRTADPALLLQSQGETYPVSVHGKVLCNINDKQQSQQIDNFPVVIDNSQRETGKGGAALTTVQVNYVREIYLQAKNKGTTLDTLELMANGVEIHAKFSDNPSYFVKFSIETNARQSIGTYFAVKEKLTDSGETPKEYIDVRVPEKAFVR